jgi:hypothetical protein
MNNEPLGLFTRLWIFSYLLGIDFAKYFRTLQSRVFKIFAAVWEIVPANSSSRLKSAVLDTEFVSPVLEMLKTLRRCYATKHMLQNSLRLRPFFYAGAVIARSESGITDFA